MYTYAFSYLTCIHTYHVYFYICLCIFLYMPLNSSRVFLYMLMYSYISRVFLYITCICIRIYHVTFEYDGPHFIGLCMCVCVDVCVSAYICIYKYVRIDIFGLEFWFSASRWVLIFRVSRLIWMSHASHERVLHTRRHYGVATISGLLEMTGLFCRILSLL